MSYIYEFISENIMDVANLKRIRKIYNNRYYAESLNSKKIRGNEILLKTNFFKEYPVGSLQFVVDEENNTREASPELMDCFVDIYTGNYHIYPKAELPKNSELYQVNQKIIDFHEKVYKCVKRKYNEADYKRISGRGIAQFATSKYVAVQKNENVYWICYEELYLDNNRVNSIAGKVQFYKTNAKSDSINKFNDKFEMLYPRKEETYKEKFEGRHKILNTEFNIYTENLDDIIQKFDHFIKAE